VYKLTNQHLEVSLNIVECCLRAIAVQGTRLQSAPLGQQRTRGRLATTYFIFMRTTTYANTVGELTAVRPSSHSRHSCSSSPHAALITDDEEHEHADDAIASS